MMSEVFRRRNFASDEGSVWNRNLTSVSPREKSSFHLLEESSLSITLYKLCAFLMTQTTIPCGDVTALGMQIQADGDVSHRGY